MRTWSSVGMGETDAAVGAAAAAGDGLQVRCFGHFEVVRHGTTVQDWRRDKAKLLLKHLVARNGSIHRDVLLDLLWPDLEADCAMRNLRVTLHALRRAVEGQAEGATSAPYVLTRGDAYELNPTAQVWVDTGEFATLYESGARLARRGRIEDAVHAYEAAQALYRDDYLIDDLYADWTLVTREQFKDQYLLVLTRLADASSTVADYETCIGYCHKILSRDAAREDVYQRLMRCHARMGRRARALRWYELCREMLQRDLNVAPGADTVQLAQSIATGAGDDRPASSACQWLQAWPAACPN